MNIIQMPNPPLIIALLGLALSKFTSGTIHKFGLTIFIIALTIWAYGEITSGINWFRRLLGLFVLFYIAYSLITQLP